MTTVKSAILAELERLRREHYICPGFIDEFTYSCPQSQPWLEQGGEPRPCNCGADDHNARIDQLISLISACHISKPGLPCHEPYNPHK